MTILVPDSIEPYTGYKWLDVTSDGSLRSGHDATEWPVLKPLEARCTAFHGWDWVPRTWEECVAPKDWQGRLSVTSAVAFSTPTVLPVPVSNPHHPPRPTTSLPYGYDWSLEPLRKCEEVPNEACSCGVYLARTKEGCAAYARGGALLVEVALWGKVIVGTDGARGQYAYPQRAYVFGSPSSFELKVAERYGIPVEQAPPTAPPIQEWGVSVGHFRSRVVSQSVLLPKPTPPRSGMSFPMRLALMACIVAGIPAAATLISGLVF